jgi:hypothetical protein
MVVQPSLVAIARQQQQQPPQRPAPSPIPPLVARSTFDTDDAYKAYMKERRKAQERVREYNRPPRAARAAQPSAPAALVDAVARMRTRGIDFDVAVETGRKRMGTAAEQRAAMEAIRAERRPMEPAARHAVHERDAAQYLKPLPTAVALHAALVQRDEWAGVTLSQVRRAVTAAEKQEDDGSREQRELDRWERRAIQKRLSNTRPSVYAGKLKRKREAYSTANEQRREARTRKRAASAAAIAFEQWEYDRCCAEEDKARKHGADDLWYVREARYDAGCALRIARGSSEVPRWTWAESAIGPLTWIQKYGEQRCDSCGRRFRRCKCDLGQCVLCKEVKHKCTCPWDEHEEA